MLQHVSANVGDRKTRKSLLQPLGKAQRWLCDSTPQNDDKSCKELDKFIDRVDRNEDKGNLDPDTAADFRYHAREIKDEVGCDR